MAEDRRRLLEEIDELNDWLERVRVLALASKQAAERTEIDWREVL